MNQHYDPLQFDNYLKPSRDKMSKEISAERIYASLVTRYMAAILDAVIVIVVGVMVGMISTIFIGAVIIICYVLIPGFSHKQATLGQQALNIHVVTEDPLKNTNILHHAVRYIAYNISMIPFGAGVLMALFNKQNMTFHDWVSGTRVVVASKLAR